MKHYEVVEWASSSFFSGKKRLEGLVFPSCNLSNRFGQVGQSFNYRRELGWPAIKIKKHD